ncbi:MAG: excisionase family DNA-binding protein [Chloroflexota bacterium]|nr:excisionase family DNA-binding protein [Chloroflexota bacterium]
MADTSPFQETIDKTVRLVYSQMHRYHVKLFGKAPDAVSVEGLRDGPLGQDLSHLGRLARGEEQANQDEVFRAVNSVLELLFWPAGEDQYQVPRSFWEEPLGKMLSQAKLRAVDASELMSIGNAAQRLGVTRPTIYRWMDDHTLNYVRDEMSGRTFVFRQDVDLLHDEASHMTHDQILPRTDDGYDRLERDVIQ